MDNYNDLTERQKGLFENDIPKILRHYTKLPCLLKILESQKFKLSDTDNFNDPKDKAWSNAYKKATDSKKLYTLCFTWETELIHHWNTYAGDKFGCYLAFNGADLIQSAKEKNIKYGCVNYIKNIKTNSGNILASFEDKEKIPFSKAWAYRCEHEYRFVSTEEKTLDIKFDHIRQIVITSKMDDDLFDFYKDKIEKIYKGRISHSSLEEEIEEG